MELLDSGRQHWQALRLLFDKNPRTMRALLAGALAVPTLGAVGAYYQYQLATNLESLWSRQTQALHILSRIEKHAYRMTLAATGEAVTASPQTESLTPEPAGAAVEVSRGRREAEQDWQEIEKLLAGYVDLAVSPERAALSEPLLLSSRWLRQATLEFAVVERDPLRIAFKKEAAEQAGREFEASVHRATEAEWLAFEVTQQHARSGARHAQFILLATWIAATMLACLLGFLFSKQQRDAALEAGRLKGRFLANMSHEIRTPMNVIIGMTELVLDSPLQPGQRRHLSMVRSSAESLLAVINDILDFSKIEAGRLDLEAVELDLVETLSEATRSLSVRAHQKGLKLICNVQPDIPEALVGDPLRLKQVIINLVSNAIRFTEEGVVRVRARLQEESGSQILVHIAVSDTGAGIPADKQESIFDSFAQLDGSISRRHGGTGLGLAICRQLVRLMGGEIRVQSQLDQGSTFFFVIPFGHAQPKPPPAVAHTLKGARVLIFDRDSASRHTLAEMLDTWCMEAAVADSCPVALEVIRLSSKLGRPFSLLLLSLETIEAGGEALLGLLRANPELRSVPVVLLAEQEPTPGRLARFSASHCLVKPISQSQFLETVERALGRSGARSLAALQQASATGAPAVAVRGSGPHVLLVEDIIENQLLTKELLRQKSYSAVVASNGKEAVQTFKQQRFDLVLMDIQMPEMGGVEATLLIRQWEKETGCPRTPILALTAHAIKGDRERYLEAGMDGYVTKPIRRQQLYDEIDSLVGAPSTPVPPAASTGLTAEDTGRQGGREAHLSIENISARGQGPRTPVV